MSAFWISFVGVLMVTSITAHGLGESFGECFTPNRERGQCIRINDCQPLLELLAKTPLSNTDRDFLRRSRCGTRNNDVLVCCAVQARVTTSRSLNLNSSQHAETAERLGEFFRECFTPDRERGQCIRFEDCRPLFERLKKTPLSNTDRDFLRRSRCGTRDNHFLGCCAVQSRVTTYESLLPSPGVCGSGYMNRIVGGKRTKIDEFPWMVLLNYDKITINEKGFHCGGSLINNRYVITASHCVNKLAIPTGWRLTWVRLGEWDTNTSSDCDGDDCNEPPVDVPIEEFITNPSYQPGSTNQFNDIALLRLSRNVAYTDFIKPVCLPLEPHLQSATLVGTSLDVAGWGKTETAWKSNVKLKARVDVVALNTCAQVYKSQRQLQDAQICAGGEAGIDSCTGDSGSPLVGFDKSGPKPYFYLAGLVSFGPAGCGREGWPGVYTRISSYIDWIQSNIRP